MTGWEITRARIHDSSICSSKRDLPSCLPRSPVNFVIMSPATVQSLLEHPPLAFVYVLSSSSQFGVFRCPRLCCQCVLNSALPKEKNSTLSTHITIDTDVCKLGVNNSLGGGLLRSVGITCAVAAQVLPRHEAHTRESLAVFPASRFFPTQQCHRLKIPARPRATTIFRPCLASLSRRTNTSIDRRPCPPLEI